MRGELVLILWVTALAPLVMTNFYSDSSDQQISSSGDSVMASALKADVSLRANLGSMSGRIRPALPEVNASLRPMFRVDASNAVPVVAVPAAANIEQIPSLKGIIQRSGVNLAVFLPAPNAAHYVVVQSGGAVGGYRVVAIMSDSVSLVKMSGGSPDIWKLQGAGELP